MVNNPLDHHFLLLGILNMAKIAIHTFKTALDSVALSRFITPVVSNRNRLEGEPRIEDFDRSLRAEIHDPLWMISRQWQLGEFQGEDSGTAFQAQIFSEHRIPQQVNLGGTGKTLAYNAAEKPLEIIVEREVVPINLYGSVEIARYLHRVMTKLIQDHNRPHLLAAYPIQTVSKQADATPGVYIVEEDDREAHYLKVSVVGRMPDGAAMLADMRAGLFIGKIMAQAGFSPADKPKMEEAQKSVVDWYSKFYDQPAPDEKAWIPSNLEYNFSIELPAEEGEKRALTADQYASGHLDWYDFDETKHGRSTDRPSTQSVQQVVQTFLPAPLRFSGMPHPRYWQMEESRTDFGKIDTSPTGLLTVLLAEYGLTYSNDWFVLPYEMNINTLCEAKGILIRDNFGMYTFIEPTVDDPETDWSQFATFHHTERENTDQKRSRYYLPPVVGKLYESDPVEKVNFMRDEMANMVWAIEHIVPSQNMGGWTQRRSLFRLAQDFVPVKNPTDPKDPAKIRYVLGSTVPENWIPFIPVPIPASSEVRLQRARMPQAPAPRSRVVSEKETPYFVEESEVPRAGVIVERSYQRTRWLKGRSYLWLGRRKMAGRGEGWSGLMFDQIVPIEGR